MKVLVGLILVGMCLFEMSFGKGLDISSYPWGFDVSMEGVVMFGSGDFMVSIGNSSYSLSAGTLRSFQPTSSPRYTKVSDALGSAVQYNFYWEILEHCGTWTTAPWHTFVRHYTSLTSENSDHALGTMIFGQTFQEDVSLDLPKSSVDDVVSAFPSFTIPPNVQEMGYHSFAGNQLGFAEQSSGLWNSTTSIQGGIAGTSPLFLFSKNLSHSCVLSPFSQFMAASFTFPSPGHIQYGVFGRAKFIPKGFTMETILSCWDFGLNEGVKSWGNQLLRYYGKSGQDQRVKDYTLQYLGYSTDNGAFYYYNTEKGLNYQQTMKEIAVSAKEQDIPFKYVLLDSWWYYRDPLHGNGALNWTARPDIFPQGLEQVFEDTEWYVQAHNRYWSANTVYAKQNGGDYDFLIDPEGKGSVPISERFWKDLLGPSTSRWGLKVYEQDWLHGELTVVDQLLENVTLAREWLLQMGQGAEEGNVAIQYCMSYPRHVLQSVEIYAVTQIRAGEDYHPGLSNQWKIGPTSLFAWAVGLSPSKDTFWSASDTLQSGNPYSPNTTEPYSRLHSAVLALSTGPVAVGDKKGMWNEKLLGKHCTSGGVLLAPDKPGTPIDRQYLSVFGQGIRSPKGQVWYSYSSISGRDFTYVLSAVLDEEFVLYPEDIGLSGQVYGFESNHTETLIPFSSSNPLRLGPNGMYDFQMWTFVSPDENGWIVKGETAKWVSGSRYRFQNIMSTTEQVLVSIKGEQQEQVVIEFTNARSMKTIYHSCTVPRSGTVQIGSRDGCISQDAEIYIL